MIKIAVDAMGGDYGPAPIIRGVYDALKLKDFEAILVGDEKEVLPLIPEEIRGKVSIVNSNSVISMEQQATDALKIKDSSIYIAVGLVKDSKANAVVSAGHSGATMSLATLRIGRVKNVLRPAIATLMPTITGKKSLVLDVGANVDSKPEHLYQFAIMGSAYCEDVLKRKNPKIGLLSNGEEDSKGNEVTKEAFALMQKLPNFIGNIEGNNIFDGSVDVIVCDGFVGNILLKTSEGVADTIGKFIKLYTKASPFASLGAIFMNKVFKKLKAEIDYAEYGGAPLLGVNGCAIVSHGKSNEKAIKNAIFQAIHYVESNVNIHIEKSLS